MKNNIANTQEARLVKLVQGALHKAVRTHGAINEELVTSVSETICSELLAVNSCVESALGSNTEKLHTAEVAEQNEVTVPHHRGWATSRNVRPVIAKRRKPRTASQLVS